MKGTVMNVFVALAVGYVVGAKTGAKEFGKLSRSVKALCETDEFADVVSVARSQVATTLRELASIVDGERPAPETGDVLARVRHLVGDRDVSDLRAR
jgi:hypothetical protein